MRKALSANPIRAHLTLRKQAADAVAAGAEVGVAAEEEPPRQAIHQVSEEKAEAAPVAE